MKKTVTSRDVHGNDYQVSISELSWRPSVYAIVIRDGKLLLTKQHGTYHLPGGGVELGEGLEEALYREVQEETGVIVKNFKLIDCLYNYFSLFDGKETRHHQTILLLYKCDYAGGELSAEGFMEDEKPYGEMPEWIPLDNLNAIDFGSTIDWRGVVMAYLTS